MTLFWMHLRKDIKKMTKIIFATGNAGKMREIRDIMADLDVELHERGRNKTGYCRRWKDI